MAHVPPQCCWGHGCPGQVALQKPVELSLLCRGHSWAVKLQWLEFLPSVWHLLSQPGIPPWLKRWSGLLHLVLCYPEPQPQAHKRMFPRPERSSQCWMLFWPSFKFMGDFFAIYPQKSCVWTLKMLQATLLWKCHTVHLILYIKSGASWWWVKEHLQL